MGWTNTETPRAARTNTTPETGKRGALFLFSAMAHLLGGCRRYGRFRDISRFYYDKAGMITDWLQIERGRLGGRSGASRRILNPCGLLPILAAVPNSLKVCFTHARCLPPASLPSGTPKALIAMFLGKPPLLCPIVPFFIASKKWRDVRGPAVLFFVSSHGPYGVAASGLPDARVFQQVVNG